MKKLIFTFKGEKIICLFFLFIFSQNWISAQCVLSDPYKQSEYDFAIELGERNPDIPRRWGTEWDRLKSGEVCDVCELNMPSNFQFICRDGYATALFFRTFDVPGEGVITYIPESIGSLTKLEGIIVRDNTIFNNAPLTNLPESIGNLINLVNVDFSAAGLTELPESFSNLVNLDDLEIRNNNLTKLPENIGNLSSLRRFSAPANQIETLPPSIGDLSNLRSLFLIGNQISCLPNEFSNLCQNDFTTFDISSNPVNASLSLFCANPQDFTCSNNGNGSTVPCGDITITSDNNQITIKGRVGVSYQMMQIIDITDGVYIPATICRGNCGDQQTVTRLSEGQYLVKVFNPDWSLACDLAFDTPIQVGGGNNNAQCVLSDPYKQAEYDFAIELGELNPDIQRRWGVEWDRLKSGEVCDVCELNLPFYFQLACRDGYIATLFFRTFDQPETGVINIIPASIGNLSRLEAITIMDAKTFTGSSTLQIPENIGSLNNLNQLSLGGSGVDELPESISNLIKLESLDVGSNRLNSLPENIGNLINLTALNLGNNNLSTLPKSIGSLTNLISLTLSSNEISCLPIEFSKLCFNNFRTFTLQFNPLNVGLSEYCTNPENFTCSNNGNTLTVPCGNISITTENNQVTITGLSGVNYQMMQIIDITDGAYAPNTICRGNCGDKQTVSGLSEGQYLIKVFNPDWSLACDLAFDTPIQIGGGNTGCIDQDRDGICSIDDCNDFDRNYPKTPGTECDDGNPNTMDDVIQSDGCTCSGTPSSVGNLILCDNFEIRYDGSGLISVENKAQNGSLRSVYLQKINPKNGAYLGSPELICNENCNDPEQFSTEPGVYFIQSFDATYSTCQTETFIIGGTNSNRMLGFEVENRNRVINLFWTDLEVEDGDTYEIERAEDGVNFETFKVMTVDENSNSSKFFQVEDSDPLIGFSFYRLKLISHTGEHYSTIKRVHIDDIEDFGLFPNPASSEINVSLSRFEGKRVRVLLMNQLGNILSEREVITNLSRYEIDLNGIPNGIYSIWIFAEGKKPMGKRFIKSDSY